LTQSLHHALIRWIGPFSQGTSSIPFIILSIVSAQCRLYGTIQSGSSWCIRPQLSHINRRINRFFLVPSLSVIIRCLQLRANSGSSHIGHILASFVLTKYYTVLFIKTVFSDYYHFLAPARVIISYYDWTRYYLPLGSAACGHFGSAVFGHRRPAKTITSENASRSRFAISPHFAERLHFIGLKSGYLWWDCRFENAHRLQNSERTFERDPSVRTMLQCSVGCIR